MASAAARASARRAVPTAGDENDTQLANRSTRHTESYAWSHYASAEALRTPNHDCAKRHHQRHERDDDSYDWHYQETPPARTRQAYSNEAAVDDGFKTPEAGARGTRTTVGVSDALPTATTRGASPDGETQQFQTAAEFAQSQYKRRNRLEKRLEELQKDVASLTMKLRSSSNRSTSTGHVSVVADTPSAAAARSPAGLPLPPARESRRDRAPLAEHSQTQHKLKHPPPSPVVKIKKNRLDKPRVPRSNLSEHSTTPTKGRLANHVSMSTMRELHKVTTERDQLRFELEKTKRTLTSTEKKYGEALKVREAYEKLKAHCESLQESLDLSEKIRVRQKKLLHQLQQNQLQQQQSARPSRSDAPSAPKAHKEPARTSAATAKTTRKTASHAKTAVRDSVYKFPSQYAAVSEHIQYDILDSLVDSSEPNGFGGQRGFSRDEPVVIRPSRSRAPVPSQPSKQARGASTYADFDSLLQKVHSPHPYTMTKSSRMKHQESSRISRRDQADASATTTKRIRSKSQGPPVTAHAAKTRSSSNHFLAPTQASLQRMQSQPRRFGEQRRPFI